MDEMMLSRRSFLKKVGAGALGLTLASSNFSSVFGQGEFSDVTLEFWDVINVQSDAAAEIVPKVVKSFEDRTGANVNISYFTFGDVYVGPKYRTAFQAGRIPDAWNMNIFAESLYYEYLVPVNDYLDEYPEMKERYATTLQIAEDAYSGYKPGQQFSVPFLYEPNSPWVARMDHFDEAGIPREEFPPRNIGHWLSICQRLKNAGVTEYPTRVYGSKWDVDEYFPQFAGAHEEIADSGLWIKEDWSEANINNKVWQSVTQTLVDVYREFEFTFPGTPTDADEPAAEAIANGNTSIVTGSPFNRPIIQNRAPELVEDGTIQFGPMFNLGGGSGWACNFETMVTTAAREKGGEKRERAAFELAREFTLPKWQIPLAEAIGSLPGDETLWGELSSPDNYYESLKVMAEEGMVPFPAHPMTTEIEYQIFGANASKFFDGTWSVKEGLARIEEEINETLEKTNLPD